MTLVLSPPRNYPRRGLGFVMARVSLSRCSGRALVSGTIVESMASH